MTEQEVKWLFGTLRGINFFQSLTLDTVDSIIKRIEKYNYPKGKTIIKDGEEYIVKNARLERLISMTNLENKEALEYLKNRLKRMKVGDRLKRMGIDVGSTVVIGNLVFELLE